MPEASLIDRFRTYLDASPSPFHAARTAAEWLEGAGFSALDERGVPEALPAGACRYVHRAGSLIAFRIGRRSPSVGGFRIIAAHTDSPNLRIKPQPLVRSHGYVRLGVEVYGGVLIASWADRDLGIAGRVFLRDGQGHREALVDLRRPLCRIPNLAIHLNRKVNDTGLKLNPQTQLPALLALGDKDGPDPLRALLADELDCRPEDPLTWDLMLYALSPARVSGAGGEFLHSARLDNLGSCHAALEGMLASLDVDPPDCTSVIALFDHEEIGSTTSRGARGRLLEATLAGIVDQAPVAPGGLERALVRSFLISADMAHAVHPGFADKHDAEHMPRMNAGPVIKLNQSQRYATEGDSASLFLRLCERVEAPYQWFVNRSDLRCGSTVGPMVAARLGIPGLDVGNAMLSMHSAREMCGTADQPHMVAVMAEYLRGALSPASP